MKILIIRHGEPDYKRDSLTEKGWREAEYLAEYLPGLLAGQAGENVPEGQIHYYMSPLGRAKDTASLTLQKLGRTAELLPWLREFDVKIHRPDSLLRKHIPWDWLPQDWTQDPRFYQEDHWFENERMAAGGVGEEYLRVTAEFDGLLAKHGYRRDGRIYRAEKPNHDILVLFCHFGVGSVLLSHLWGVSPMPVWHGTCAQATSITTLVTEERREGIALFRMLSFGEVTHLYLRGEEPSFAARFCECYGDDTRHD